MEQNLKNERKYHIDILRIIACFSVVLIHLTATNTRFSTFSEQTQVFFNNITRFSVPLFFMISGALFLNKNKLDFKQIYFKYILKLLIILAIWLTSYGILNFYRYGGEINNLYDLKQILVSLINNQYHFWFLFPLISIYIVLPILKKISEDKKVLMYFLVLFFIFVIGFETLKVFFGYNSNKIIWFSLFRPEIICGYSGYFLLGYYLENYNIKEIWYKLITFLGIISFIVVSLGGIYISKFNGIIYNEFCNNFLFTSFIMAVFVYLWGKKFFLKIKYKSHHIKWITFISNNTLGIYIFHNLFRYLIEDYNFYDKIIYGPVSLLTASGIICILCILLSILIKKIPYIGKYLI